MSKSKLKINSKGVKELLNDSAIKDMVRLAAVHTQAVCGSGYAYDTHKMPNREIASVYTANTEGMKDNSKNNTILKSLRA